MRKSFCFCLQLKEAADGCFSCCTLAQLVHPHGPHDPCTTVCPVQGSIHRVHTISELVHACIHAWTNPNRKIHLERSSSFANKKEEHFWSGFLFGDYFSQARALVAWSHCNQGRFVFQGFYHICLRKKTKFQHLTSVVSYSSIQSFNNLPSSNREQKTYKSQISIDANLSSCSTVYFHRKWFSPWKFIGNLYELRKIWNWCPFLSKYKLYVLG